MMKRLTMLAASTAFMLSAASASAQSVIEYAGLVQEVAQSELQEWITDPIFLYAINEQNETFGTLKQRRIDRMDKAWRAEQGSGPMIFDLLDRQASIILRDRRELSNGVITEIILMDQYGLNVAISDPTSDFYQGDEAKYQQTYLKGPGAVHVSEIEFDESTGFDQTQVSMTVTDPESGKAIGAVTFGINLEVLQNLSN
ncbi:MAG: hypothetical protein AAF074_15805 [Pseudomonadota bacterium]